MPHIYYTTYTPISDSLSEIRKQEHTLGRRLLVRGLQELYHLSVSEDTLPPLLSTTETGKPYLPAHPDIQFNISHCDGLVVCAFDKYPVGVDAELPGYFAEILINHSLSEQEKSFLQSAGTTPALRQEWFYRFWTLKEAYVKKTGTGVDADLKAFSFSFFGNAEPYQIRCSNPSITCWQEKLPSGQILSLCYEDKGEEISFMHTI